MARKSKNTSDTLLADLVKRLEELVETARREGREDALAEVRDIVMPGASRATSRKPAKKQASKKAAKKKTKSGKPRKNPWAGLSDEQRLARINAIRKGRGLPLRKSL